MQALRQMGGGLLLGLLSITIVIGGISLALAEGYVPQPPPIPTETPFINQSAPPPTALPPTALPSPIPTDTPTVTPLPPINCLPPSGWVLVTVNPGETLEILAARYKTTPEVLSAANCLGSASILPGYGIYVPPVPTNTPIPCGAPFGWVQYTVQSGDNLYHISQLYRVTVSQLQQANCLGYSTTIYTGQRLWVPNVATSTPLTPPITIEFATPTPVPTDTPSPTETPALEPTATGTSIPPSETPTPTPIPTDTPTDTPPATP